MMLRRRWRQDVKDASIERTGLDNGSELSDHGTYNIFWSLKEILSILVCIAIGFVLGLGSAASSWMTSLVGNVETNSAFDSAYAKPIAPKSTYSAYEIIERTCSHLPASVQNMTFPLHMKKNPKNPDNDLKSLPTIWLFDSGVMLKTEYLKDFMINRFWKHGSDNIWELIDEKLMMKAIGDLYHRCEAEECVFVDGGAAFGYYSQLISRHFPLVKVLAFNPHPTFVEQMLDNLALSRTEGVCLQQKGLSDKIGMSTMTYGVDGKIGTEGVEVSVTTLDEYYENFGLGKLVVAIKLDVEGFGGKVIQGSPKMISAAQNVFVGIHNKEERKECQNLMSLGFTILDHSKFAVGQTPNDLCVATKNQNWHQ